MRLKFVLALVVCVAVGSASAQDTTFLGTVDTDFHDLNNWDNGVVTSTTVGYVEADSVISSPVTVGNDFRQANGLGITADLDINADLTIDGSSRWGFDGTSTVDIGAGVTVDAKWGLSLSWRVISADRAGSCQVTVANDGRLEVGEFGGFSIDSAIELTGTAEVYLTSTIGSDGLPDDYDRLMTWWGCTTSAGELIGLNKVFTNDPGKVVVFEEIAGGGVWDPTTGTFLDAGRFYIPEPATMSLLVLGGLAVLRRRR